MGFDGRYFSSFNHIYLALAVGSIDPSYVGKNAMIHMTHTHEIDLFLDEKRYANQLKILFGWALIDVFY